jgi:hypothetical protein
MAPIMRIHFIFSYSILKRLGMGAIIADTGGRGTGLSRVVTRLAIDIREADRLDSAAIINDTVEGEQSL